jgi:hypothetical protein
MNIAGKLYTLSHDDVFTEFGLIIEVNFFCFLFRFPTLFAICIHTFKFNQQIVCWEARASRQVLCSTPP